MPPKRKKVGRPPGSKNKKSINKDVNGTIDIDIKVEVDVKKSPVKHKCDACTRVFDTHIGLRRHERACKKRNIGIAEKKAVYNCNECSKKFRFKKSYEEHILTEHSKVPGYVACDKCAVRCPNKDTLKNHIEKVHDRDIFECPDCLKKFVRRSHVLRHMAQKGCGGRRVSVFPCDICSATFTRKDNLMVHLRLQHISNNDYKCKHCTYHTRKFSKLIIHTQRYHSENPHQFICDYCGKMTSSRAAIAKHLEIHGEKKYACDVCGYSTYTIEVIRRHVLTHVKEKPYKCTLCDRSYIQRVQLQRHLEKHTGNMCHKCGATFKSKANLLIHKREHMGLDKLFCPIENCLYAKKEFTCEASLNCHIKMHLEEKLYKCEVCSKKFHSEGNMRRHVATHALDRPRRCMYCVAARAYVRGEQLVRHVRKQHPAIFRDHLAHVRQVLGNDVTMERVKKSEMESILNVLDAESERIIQGYGEGVLYGGMQEQDSSNSIETLPKNDENPLMSEEELAENLKKLLTQLINKDTLECFGWPEESVDVVLEKVIEQCGARAADRERWTRVQRLRENTKHLFLYVIEDKNIARMLDTHTIDQIVKHILTQVTEGDVTEE